MTREDGRANGSRASRPKAWLACVDRSSRPHRITEPNPASRRAERSRRCAASATPASRSPRRSASRRPPSAASCRRLGLNRLTRPGAGRAGAPLRARAPRRDDPHRHQEARPLRRVGHRITGDRTGQSNSRGAGWEFVHVCIDDASRIAFSQILPDEKKESAVAFLKAAVAYYASLGVTVARVMTDNGSCYQAFAFRELAAISASSTSAPSPTRPKPTARPSASSRPRCANGPTPRPTTPQSDAPRSCPIWLHRYNWHRPHGGIKSKRQSAASA